MHVEMVTSMLVRKSWQGAKWLNWDNRNATISRCNLIVVSEVINGYEVTNEINDKCHVFIFKTLLFQIRDFIHACINTYWRIFDIFIVIFFFIYFSYTREGTDIKRNKRKRRRSDLVLWQNPLYQQKIRKPKDNTQTPPKTSITQRLRTDLGRSVGVTSHPNGVIKPVYGYPTFPLTTKAV